MKTPLCTTERPLLSQDPGQGSAPLGLRHHAACHYIWRSDVAIVRAGVPVGEVPMTWVSGGGHFDGNGDTT